jgi:hypothetical protein
MPVSTPVLDLDGKLLDFYTGWRGRRKFPTDMAAFAVNLKYFIQVKNHLYGKINFDDLELIFGNFLSNSSGIIKITTAKIGVWLTSRGLKRPIGYLKFSI